jgi:hypothetical protein
VEEENIFHENRENLRSHDEEETARLTLPQEATERTKQVETKNKTKNKKHTHTHTHNGMNKSASLTPVQGPSTVVCMIVT